MAKKTDDDSKFAPIKDLEVMGDDYNGVIGTGDTEQDYQLCKGVLDLPKARNGFWKFEYQIQQSEIGRNTCTLAGSIGALQDLIGKELTKAQKNDIYEEALTLGFEPALGWYTRLAVDLVKEWAVKNGHDIKYYRLDVGSDEYLDAINKGYSIVSSFRGNSAYNKDKNEDGDIDNTSFGKTTYGHCIRHVKNENQIFPIHVVDNYFKTSKHNIYSAAPDVMEGLIKNSVWSKFGYVYAYDVDESESELWKRVPVWAKKSYEKAIKKGISIDLTNPLKIVGTDELEKTLIDLKVFTAKEGNVTEARWITALDRMGKLD